MSRRAPFLLQRYVLGELLLNLTVSLVVITSVFFVGMLLQSLYRWQELPMTTILTLIPYFIPYSITFTIPLTALIATVQTYGRMAADNEILAVRTGGIHLYPLFAPLVFLGVVLSAVNVRLNDVVVPYCLAQRKHITSSSLDEVLVKLKTGDHTIPIRKHTLTFTIKEDGTYSNILIVAPGDEGEGQRKIVAASGAISVNPERETIVFHLRDGHVESQGEPVSDGAGGDEETTTTRTNVRGTFTYFPMEIDLSGQQTSLRRPLKELTFADLAYRLEREDLAEEHAEIRTEYHKRISMAFASLVFVLFGAPIGILFRKGGRLIGYLIGFSIAILVYYPLVLLGEDFGSQGTLPAAASMWGGNVVVGVAGILLMIRLFRK
jgi:lipopolysaccharide export system permease protein